MEISHETLERVLKIYMDKLKFSLGLEFRNTDYSVQLVDYLKSDFIITKGETVSIKILTDRFIAAMERDPIGLLKHPKDNYHFRQSLEKCLRLVPRMFNVLASPAIADALVYNPETDKFKKVKGKKAQIFEHDFEKEVTYTNDHRSTAIHWKSGTIVREYGPSTESAVTKARSKMILLLQDPTIYNRNEDQFVTIESHTDIIYDLVVQASILNKDEIRSLISQLEGEYLNK